MNTRNIWTTISIILLMLVSIFAGYRTGLRDTYNFQEDNLVIQSPNQAIQNSLSEIQNRKIVGQDSMEIRGYGTLFFKIENQKTEILIKLENVPDSFTQKSSQYLIDIPSTLSVQTLARSKDGLSWQRQEVGKIVLNNNSNNNSASGREGKLSLILNRPIINSKGQIERIIFDSPDDSSQENTNRYTFDRSSDNTVPLEEDGKPAPYFWVRV